MASRVTSLTCGALPERFVALRVGNAYLSEARIFGLRLILANQCLTQLKDEHIIESVFGKVGTLVCFRGGRKDAELLESQFLPFLDVSDLANLSDWTACIKATVQAEASVRFTLHTIPAALAADSDAARSVRELSRQKYSRPRAEVEREIEQSPIGSDERPQVKGEGLSDI